MKTDVQIQKDVMAELSWEPILNACEIGVAVKNQVVTLSGTVDTSSKKLAAISAAKRVYGVKAVALDIEVHPANSKERNDSEIAQVVVKALFWSSRVPDEQISVKVDNGWVTLEGTVEWEYQKRAAEEVIEDLLGIKGVINNIMIATHVQPNEVKNKIEAAFDRSATIDASKIEVQTEGPKVILKGKVRSWAEKKDAEKAAYAAPGVTEVKNELLVEGERVPVENK